TSSGALLEPSGAPAHSPDARERLRAMLSAPPSLHAEIDELYNIILRGALKNQDAETADLGTIQSILYTIADLGELEAEEIAGILDMPLARVVAVLSVVQLVGHARDVNRPVVTIHASFPDYLLDPQCSKEYGRDAEAYNHFLARRCFDCIGNAKQEFNICGLKSSYILDADIPDLDGLVARTIPPEMVYACKHWATHMHASPDATDLEIRLQGFLTKLVT
ncbi:hypothetical protein FRC11_003473, partial [Ceratobasidium sp. 423]